jgi:hypothetical protein
LHALSVSLRDGLCFFRILTAAAPSACLTVCLPCVAHGEETAFPRSAYITMMSTVDETWTPVILQFRTGTLETCNLTTSYTHRGACFDRIIPVGLSPLNDACGSSVNFTIVLDSSPSPEGISGWVSASQFSPVSVRCRIGFTPRHQRNGSMPS